MPTLDLVPSKSPSKAASYMMKTALQECEEEDEEEEEEEEEEKDGKSAKGDREEGGKEKEGEIKSFGDLI